MGLLDLLFGKNKKQEKIREALDSGALLIDVRTPAEYKQGSVKGAINYPVQNIDGQIAKIKKSGKPVVAFCASGMRSAAASAKLKANGIEAYNAGSITGMGKYMK